MVGLTYISLVAGDVGHFFLCLWAICMWVKVLSRGYCLNLFELLYQNTTYNWMAYKHRNLFLTVSEA